MLFEINHSESNQFTLCLCPIFFTRPGSVMPPDLYDLYIANHSIDKWYHNLFKLDDNIE